jgi:hypothetical protein
VAALVVIVVSVAAGGAVAGTITSPIGRVAVPVDPTQKDGLGFVAISASGYPPGANVSVMVCNGNNPNTDPQWDPNADCDSGSSPPAQIANSTGKVTFPANGVRGLVFFEGADPSNTFDCLYAGQADPQDGLRHWGGGNQGDGPPCQIMVSTNLVQRTNDQVLEPITLPKSPSSACTANCTQPTPTTTAPAGGTPVAPASSTGSAGSVAASDGGVAASDSSSTTDPSSLTASSPSSASATGTLPFTGLAPARLLVAAAAMMILGLACVAASRRRVPRHPA